MNMPSNQGCTNCTDSYSIITGVTFFIVLLGFSAYAYSKVENNNPTYSTTKAPATLTLATDLTTEPEATNDLHLVEHNSTLGNHTDLVEQL